jgi:hypothetical protein
MDAGHRADDASFPVVHVEQDQIRLAHRLPKPSRWDKAAPDRPIPPRG